MTFTPEQIEKLSAKLDGSVVKPPPKGKYGSYLEGWHVIAEANRIFGFDGWSYRIDRLERTNDYGYLAIVTVEAGGVSRQDVGHGQGHQKGEGDAIESAAKEAVTDGLKRALKSFGNPFGLALYDKSGDNVERATEAPKRAPVTVSPAFTQQKAEDLIRIIKATTSLDELVWLWTDEANAIASLPASWKETVTAAKDEQKRRLGA